MAMQKRYKGNNHMTHSQELKKLLSTRFALKGLRVRTIKCKDPILEFWLPYELNAVLPNELRRAAVLANYRVSDLSQTGVINHNDIDYGNTHKRAISIRYSEIDSFKKHLNL